ncbi:hypothetical protein JCM10914A_20580 [Paenibacillus sp. JCM 10914]
MIPLLRDQFTQNGSPAPHEILGIRLLKNVDEPFTGRLTFQRVSYLLRYSIKSYSKNDKVVTNLFVILAEY